MRLIDADELEMKVVYRDTDGWGPQYGVFAYQIREAPTIDAIPVEWLKELQTKYLEAECFMSVCVVNEMLNLWRKENGTDRQE